jgi:hypothetical protein
LHREGEREEVPGSREGLLKVHDFTP